ncbi:hypothetical protein AU184_03775 [Mycolicibacterium novocastrense]|uniref:hypothetical protein n=1 Tax=Mycolicibacterium novocastrense TaxID=59813 RepID=UPI000746C941|nr:hypothetical protein [Mycolicibacterium novocastrense]KUH70730.1 hypothetical protein AU183_18105 [Mycolicibacterium novocastrense]KUH71730.1 hypothetical protein AU072_11070 [Mycolicibacterium novocastrense]KUH72049.1 hypothetical protein AU184_03775 [Mycolicibacterium novocastrense]
MYNGRSPAEEPALLATALRYLRLPLACAKALPATDFVFDDVRPSRKIAEAFLATFALVTLLLLDFLAIAPALLPVPDEAHRICRLTSP